MRKWFNWKHVCGLLLLVVGLVLAFGPLHLLRSGGPVKNKTTLHTRLGVTPRIAMAKESELVEDIPETNTLIIPEIGVDTQILEGKSISVLKDGLWHRPKTGNPIDGGNMVIAGHRYKWTSGPNTFYHLPELHKGSRIKIFWQQKKYEYVVSDIYTVSSSAVDIEKPTKDHELTLFTCTLLTAEERVVVKALPVK